MSGVPGPRALLGAVRRTAPELVPVATTVARFGLVSPRPDRAVRQALAPLRRGRSLAALLDAVAAGHPDRPFVIDDAGSVTYAEARDRADALARALRARGVQAGGAVGILCRNHRDLPVTIAAASALGATVLLLNTDFSGPQLVGVLEREGAAAVVFDDEFAAVVADVPLDCVRVRAWTDPEAAGDAHDDAVPTVQGLVEEAPRGRLVRPRETSAIVVLTSGTTGTPKGAGRRGASPAAAVGALGLVARLPVRGGARHLISAPLFHGWGAANLAMAMALSCTVVLQRRFEPGAALAAAQEHRVRLWAMVPVMLQRVVGLGAEALAAADLPALRAIPLSGSAIPGDLALRAMDALGDVVFDFYGSTEVGWATIAAPRDLRAAPGTAGRPPLGSRVRVVDETGADVPAGTTGRIFVGSGMRMDGYTHGTEGKDVLDGLMASGDVGHLDAAGRLFVSGRDDDMIVSGGENVFPREVEDLLAEHPGVREASVHGVPDEDFGQRLRAHVVREPGAEPPLDEDAVRAHVRTRLARYKVPRDVRFHDELPRNPTGKILKRELREGD